VADHPARSAARHLGSFRITIGWTWTYLLVAELVAAQSGPGRRIMDAQRYLATDTIIFGTLFIGLLGLVADLLFKHFAAKAVPLGGRSMSPKVSINAVGKVFGTGAKEYLAIDRIDLMIGTSEFVSIVGTSGCGKSTLLNVVGGLTEPTFGDIRIDGQSVTGPGRDRGFVFQGYSLFEWLTVEGDIRFALEKSALEQARKDRTRAQVHPVCRARAASRMPIRASSRAACGSASPLRGPSSTSHRCC